MKVEIECDNNDDWIRFYPSEYLEAGSWSMTYRLLELGYDDNNVIDRDEDPAMDALIEAVEEHLDEIVYDVLDHMNCVRTTVNNPYAYMECVYDADEEDMPEIFEKIAHAVPGVIEIKLAPEYEKELEARKKEN